MNNNNNNQYKSDGTTSHLHDSWNLNKTARSKIDDAIAYYKDPQNYNTMKNYSKDYYQNHKEERKIYDRRYYRHRCNFGDSRKPKGEVIVWNLLNICGDVFT